MDRDRGVLLPDPTDAFRFYVLRGSVVSCGLGSSRGSEVGLMEMMDDSRQSENQYRVK
jgi:hypothetical protein